MIRTRIQKTKSFAERWKIASDSYLALVRQFPIRPIETNDELDEAIRMLDKLLERDAPLDRQEQGYFDSLTNEIERYEEVAVPIPDVSGVEMLKHLMQARDITLSVLAVKSAIALSTLSAILNNKRKLNLNHIKGLSRFFRVPPAVFFPG